jgi:hypothetical protein
MKYLVAGFAACTLVAPAYADAIHETAVVEPAAAASQSQQAVIIDPANQPNVLRSGTEIPLITREEFTTEGKHLRVGQRVQMEVASSVEQNGVVVIPAGAPAVGEITDVRNKGMWGKSGYINARVLSVRVGGRSFRLSGAFDNKGHGGGWAAAGVTAVTWLATGPVAGFLMTGTSAKIPSGMPVKGILEEDIAFRATQAQSTPVPPVAAR